MLGCRVGMPNLHSGSIRLRYVPRQHGKRFQRISPAIQIVPFKSSLYDGVIYNNMDDL